MIALAKPQKRRCAIYTRKSVTEGLDQDLNSLTVQREAAEAYITSQKGEGWTCLAAQYDDGGFSGGNMKRPALQSLMEAIKDGLVDCVVVYKVDRLSRSLLDFAKLSEFFDKHDVTFVSVTQQINTSTSLGRLTLGILISFAQFEREQISERTQDRMASARKKGRWVGGRPFLGYDIAPEGRSLIVNEVEAEQVRRAFKLYIEEKSISGALKRIRKEGIRLKRWVNRSGETSGGSVMCKSSLHGLLKNLSYIGKVRYKGEVFEGAHKAIVSQDMFDTVQHQLEKNDRTGGTRTRNKHDALLRGLLCCNHCKTAMTHSFTKKKASGKVYRYYVCQTAMKESWAACPTKSVSAGEIEEFVVSQIKSLGTDAELQQDVIASMLKQQAERQAKLETQIKRYQSEQTRHNQNIQQALNNQSGTEKIAHLHEQSQTNETALQDAQANLEAMKEAPLRSEDLAYALSQFHPIWDTLTTTERCDLLAELIERISYDGEAGELEITWKENGIHALLEK